MERQRSFSFKSTRFLVFSFTLSSSIFFLTVFTVWVLKSSPSILQEANIELNRTSVVGGFKSVSVHTFSVLTKNFSENGLNSTILKDIPENTSGFVSISIAREKVGSEKLKAEEDKDGQDRNFTTVQQNIAVPPESLSQNSQDKVNEGVEEKKITAISTGKGEVSTADKILKNRGIEEKKNNAISVTNIRTSSKSRIKEKPIKECDITKGRWVYDESYPLYTNSSCPFIDEGFDCIGNGRLDKDYMKWRWKPQDCDIPRFNATRMLNLIRGKRLVFVGDSINRNQWESMLCMLMGDIKDPKMVYETHGRRITKEKGIYSFKFVNYKCTVEYYVSHFLVHESKARVGQKRVQTLRIDAIDHGSSRWKGADILIFNTAHWWSHFKTKAGINYYQEGNQVHPKLDVSTAFRIALTTWASWVDRHINPRKTLVFFRSVAPSHFRGGQWNSGGHCEDARQPLNETSGNSLSQKNTIIEDIIKHMKTPVTILNVTSLSEFRIDGHPSIYGKKLLKRYSSGGQDCSHWCLPGIPDIWNELLYFQLQDKQGNNYQ